MNRHGGTLLYGAETAPKAPDRDHLACLRLLLEPGNALPRKALAMIGRSDLVEFLADWSESHPGQVV